MEIQVISEPNTSTQSKHDFATNPYVHYILLEIEEIQQNAPYGSHVVDENGYILRMNETELGWLGYSRTELQGHYRFDDLLWGDNAGETARHFDLLAEHHFLKGLEYELIRKDGTLFPVMLCAIPIYDDKAQVRLARYTIFDIREQKTLEQELRRVSDGLQVVNAEKDRIMGIISHDLQNSINVINLTAELLMKISKNSSDVEKKLIGNIQKASGRMNKLVTNILSINRIERGMLNEDWNETNMVSIVHDVIERFWILAERKSIRIEFKKYNEHLNEKTPSAFDWMIRSNPHYLVQVVENLLSNAIKFSPIDGLITIHLTKTQTDYLLQIQDEGQGIKEEEMPLLYGKFQKLSTRPTGGEASTGLGLSLVKEFIEILRGSISCKSTWGNGTCFTVQLPIFPE